MREIKTWVDRLEVKPVNSIRTLPSELKKMTLQELIKAAQSTVVDQKRL